jgi:hypothetical protein
MQAKEEVVGGRKLTREEKDRRCNTYTFLL